MNEEKKQHNLITLKFSITGKPVIEIEKVNLNQPLRVAVEKAFEASGTTRPISDYDVLFNTTMLNISSKVEELGLTDGALLMVSLKSGKGGE
ncbi:MAG: DUF2604 domain-containing protein [Mangrovibacterium sp.]|jgi:hypothetical protein